MQLSNIRSAGQIQRAHSAGPCKLSSSVAVRRVPPVCRSNIAGDSWIDLTSLVTGGGGKKSPYDELASEIGRDVYCDIGGWHLFLRDLTAAPGLKMNTALAMQFGPKAAERLSESDVANVLKKIQVSAGAGKTKVTLFELIPSRGVADLTELIEEFGRR